MNYCFFLRSVENCYINSFIFVKFNYTIFLQTVFQIYYVDIGLCLQHCLDFLLCIRQRFKCVGKLPLPYFFFYFLAEEMLLRTAGPRWRPECETRLLVPAIRTKTFASASTLLWWREGGNVCIIFYQHASTCRPCRHPSGLGPDYSYPILRFCILIYFASSFLKNMLKPIMSLWWGAKL